MNSNNNTYFVTGIGTNVGKSIVSAILVKALKADYWKPVQSGNLDYTDTDFVRELVRNTASRFHQSTYSFIHPLSPHAAAELENKTIDINSVIRPKTDQPLIIEGAGGLKVPLNDTDTVFDLIQPDDKIILVSRHYLGSINHTLLSIEAIKKKGLTIFGLIFNGNENQQTESIIQTMGNVPVLGRIDKEKEINPDVIARYANLFRSKIL